MPKGLAENWEVLKPFQIWEADFLMRDGLTFQRNPFNKCWSNLVKKDLLMQIGTCWKRYKNFGKIAILIRFTRPITERGREPHLAMSNLHLSKSGIIFLRNKFLNKLGIYIYIPKYLNRSKASLTGNAEWGKDLANWFTKNSSLFWRFNLSPHRQPNWSRIDSIGGREDVGSETYNNRSSA